MRILIGIITFIMYMVKPIQINTELSLIYIAILLVGSLVGLKGLIELDVE